MFSIKVKQILTSSSDNDLIGICNPGFEIEIFEFGSCPISRIPSHGFTDPQEEISKQFNNHPMLSSILSLDSTSSTISAFQITINVKNTFFDADVYDILNQLRNSSISNMSEIYNNLHELFFGEIMPITDKYIKNKIGSYERFSPKRHNISEPCSICRCEYKNNEGIRILDCNHNFHKKCVDRWFKKENVTCPLCRKNIFNTTDMDDHKENINTI